MKLASFIYNGREGFGVVDGDHILQLSSCKGGADLRLALPDLLRSGISGYSQDPIPLDEVEFLPPIVRGQKILCVGLNYRQHAEEAGAPIPEYPSIFTRFPDTVSGCDQPIIKALNSDEFDFEGELAVIIGKTARHVKLEDAMDFVAGYSCFADNSMRDFQRHSRQATPGKNFPASGGFGPWIITADEIPDPETLELTTRLNGAVVQESSVGDMIFSVAEQIEYLSRWTELRPGDVIATGTPSGVGAARKPPLWLKPGDVLEVEIDRIGVLKHSVITESLVRKSEGQA